MHDINKKTNLVNKLNKLKSMLSRKKEPEKQYIKVGDILYEITDSLFSLLVSALETRKVLDNINTQNGTIEIKPNLDFKTQYETISHLLFLVSSIVGEYALADEKLLEMWNNNVGRTLNIKGPIIEQIAKDGKYEIANKMSLELLKNVLDYREQVLNIEQKTQNKCM